MPLRDEYRTALVTGAASGLGAAFVAMLRAEGIEVWGTSRNRSRVPDQPGFHGLTLELGDEGSIARAWTEAEEASGGIDLVINNAGAGDFGPFHATDPVAWSHQIAVLLLGPASLSRHAMRAMRTRGRGCLVHVTSLVAEFPIPCMSAYDAAKAGLVGLTACLAQECAGTPVRIVDFRPGDYRTSFNDAMRTAASAATSGDALSARVWRRLETLMREAPDPARGAADLRRALVRRRRGVVRSGSFFQARLAPFLLRFASHRLSAWVQRRYFDSG